MEFSDYINKSKDVKKIEGNPGIRIALLSNFTINGLDDILKVISYENGINAEVYLAPYNQYMQEILNPKSRLYSFDPDIVFILLDIESFMGHFLFFPYRLDAGGRKKFINEKFEEIKNMLKKLVENMNAKIVFNNFQLPYYSGRGIIENKQEFGLRQSIRTLNNLLESFALDSSQIFIFDLDVFFTQFGHENLTDPKMNYLADLKLSHKGLIEIAHAYSNYLFPLAGKSKKCLVLDLDNTLWGGIIGEDGIAGIRLGPENDGRPFYEFQKRILELHERGIILAINSSNNYDDALEVIRKHPYMVLKEDHFASIRINWQDKVSNLREIANELNIGLDSMVFMDDDKVNCALVEEKLSEVMVVCLPKDHSLFPQTIEKLKEFNLFSITKEDIKRAESYIHQKKREQLRSSVTDLDSFIKELDIKVAVMPATKINIPRIAQLTQKTNQFNLTTKRYQEEDIQKLAASNDHLVSCISVSDKFGEYGATGVVILKKLKELWDMDSFLLSCRILGRRIEFSLMEYIIKKAKKEGIKVLNASFIPTGKNKPAEKFLLECGFKLKSGGGNAQEYFLDIESYKTKELLVKVDEWKL